jgi:hypothetical protein
LKRARRRVSLYSFYSSLKVAQFLLYQKEPWQFMISAKVGGWIMKVQQVSIWLPIHAGFRMLLKVHFFLAPAVILRLG